MIINFLLKNKNLNFLLKKTKKNFLIIFKCVINKKYNIKKKVYIKLNTNKNLFIKKKKINNIINYFFINFFIIEKTIIKILFCFNKLIIKKKRILIEKFSSFCRRNLFLYKKKISISFFIKTFKKFFLFIKNNIIVFKNKISIFKKKINNYIETKNYIEINYLIYINEKISDKIAKNNIKILKKIIKKYKKKQIYDDLYQECYSEFVEIINNFKISKKNFFRFCYWKIKKKMISIINLKRKELKKNCLSVDKPLFNHSLKYHISDRSKFLILEFARNELKNLIRSLIINLPEREQKIIRLRFGIGTPKNYTLEEIGQLYSLSRERIRQIELNVILKMRQTVVVRILQPYIKVFKILE
ncbi:sigma-70 family RNA polymerase sigma factor [Candidatus Carsonella ruddii]|uniref:RNA polymerase sigma factor RpoD n=1 Tax=Candidatus Carsonella ruddii (Diaphorina cf. continua) TaxID=2661587 RepID=A0A7R6W014_CARRU|nr:sigma-70 family RNA polymerase sigma factor [Candidatus Carsonella ruddii (Diaphorina cf. continua)]BCG49287.1 RNA polymerase sigma factor RpoD [Candidatus Carsonella ruddii (Diaphorina cf. continua)]